MSKRRSAILPTTELTLGDLLSASGQEGFASVEAAGATARLRSLWTIPIGRLAVGDLDFLIGHEIAASLLLPLALDHLERDPLLAAAGQPGSLLVTVLTTGLPHLKARQHLRERAWRVVERAERDASTRPDCGYLLALLDKVKVELG